MVAGVSIVAHVSIISVISKIDRSVGRVTGIEKPVFAYNLAEIAPLHVDEDFLLFKEVPNILTGGRVELPPDKIGNVLASTVKKKLHDKPPLIVTAAVCAAMTII